VPLLITTSTFISLVKSIMDGIGKVIHEQVLIGIVSPLLIGLFFLFARSITTSNEVMSIYFISSVAGAFLCLGVAWLYLSKSWLSTSVPPEIPRRIDNLWLTSASLSNVFLINTDIIILQHYTESSMIGFYGIISSLVTVLTVAISAGNSIYAPAIVRQYQSLDYGAARATFASVQKHVLTWSIPFFVVLCLFPEKILFLLVGAEVPTDISTSLVILCAAQMINSATGPVATSLYMKGEIKYFAKSMIFCATVNLVGCLALVPYFGVLGASISTAVSIGLANIIQYIKAKTLEII
jgi:O-antigen/teichoic acid export membrane protein